MQKRNIVFRWSALAGVVFMAGRFAANAVDSSAFVTSLQNTGLDPDARASVTASLNPGDSYVTISAEKLTPGANYVIVVQGRAQASFRANPQGKAQLSFSNPVRPGHRSLSFDPRGKSMELRQEGSSLFQSVLAAPGEPPGSYSLERADLRRAKADPSKSATAQYVSTRGDKKFKVTVNNAAGTNWWVYVDGVPRANLRVSRSVGTVLFHNQPTNSSERLLDFDPRNRVVEVVQGTNLMFSSPLQARIPHVNVATPSARPGVIPPTSAAAGGVAKTRVRTKRDAVRDFEVEVRDIPAGTYEFLANGVVYGTFEVRVTPNGTRGEIEFSTGTDDPDKLPLTFAPLASALSIRQGATTYFAGQVATRWPRAARNHNELEIEERLMSSGLDPDAHAEAQFEISQGGKAKFSVEIEHVAAGTYDLFVGGTPQGTITARWRQGKVKGQIEFSTHSDDPHELPLNFEPRGQLLEIRSAAGVLFSHLFGLGDSGSPETSPAKIKVPLFSTGLAQPGCAKAEYERDDHGEQSFEVELENVPEGAYTVWVGGQARGTINVLREEQGTRGKLEFDSSPKWYQMLLDFDPLGQVIAIERDGAVWFERTFPSL